MKEVLVSPRALLAAIVAGLLLLLGPAAHAAGPYPPPSEGGAEVSDSRVRAGDCVIFSGSGYQPGTTVTITDNGEFVDTTTADENGDFRYEMCFEADAKRGKHTLRASGLGADGRALTVSAVVYVTGVSQQPGSGGTGGAPGAGSTGSGGQTDGGTTAGGSTGGATPGPSATPAPGAGGGPKALPRTSEDDKGMGVAGWLIVLVSFAFLALLSSLILLAARRRGEDPVTPA